VFDGKMGETRSRTSRTEVILNLFTGPALRSAVAQIRKEPMPPLTWQEFESSGPHSVVKIEFARGSKEYFRDAIHFWIVFLQSHFRHANLSNADTFFHTLQQDRYTQCQELSQEEFMRTIQWYNFVEDEQVFSLRGSVQHTWQVYDEGIELALLAETQSEFAAFYWELND